MKIPRKMVVSSPEPKTLAWLNPDGTQIIYLIPPETQTGPQTVRLLRAPVQGGASQFILESPDITNLQCSRAPANVCLFGRLESKSFTFVAFDPEKGTQREVGKLEQPARGWNWSLDLAHWPAVAHDHPERLEQSVVPRLGRGRQRLFRFHQPHRPPFRAAICRLGRQRAFTLAAQKL